MQTNNIKDKLELAVKIKDINGGEKYSLINLSNITVEELLVNIFEGLCENKKFMINITDSKHSFIESVCFEISKTK